MVASIIPQLIKPGVKGGQQLLKLLTNAEKLDRRKIGNLGLNDKLKTIAHKFYNPEASTTELGDLFNMSRSQASRVTQSTGLSSPANPVGHTAETAEKIKQTIKGFNQYKNDLMREKKL